MTIRDLPSIHIGCNIVLYQDGKILLGKRSNCYGAGTWWLPGGHLEKWETFIEWAIREAYEEIGIRIGVWNIKFLSMAEWRDQGDTDVVKLQLAFLVESYDGEIINNEPEMCELLEYFSFEELPDIFVAHQDLLENIKNEILYSFPKQKMS